MRVRKIGGELSIAGLSAIAIRCAAAGSKLLSASTKIPAPLARTDCAKFCLLAGLFLALSPAVRANDHCNTRTAGVAPNVGVLSASRMSDEPAFTTPFDTIPNFALNPTIRSQQSGSYHLASTWDAGRVPDSGDVVLIRDGHQVTIGNPTAVAKTVGIAAGSLLRFDPSANTRLTVGTLLVMPDGALEVGTPASPIPAAFVAEIVIAPVPLDTTDDGVGVYDPSQFGTGVLSVDGRVTMHGSSKSSTFMRLSAEAFSGQTTLTLAAPVTGWQAGDRLVLPDSRQIRRTDFDLPCSGRAGGQCPQRDLGTSDPLCPVSLYLQCPEWEELTLQSVSPDGRTLTLASPLQFDHFGARDGEGTLDFLPHVGNLGRNVVIRSAQPEGVRGHTLFTRRSVVDIRYTLFRELARTVNAIPTGAGNQIGRYFAHMHHLIGLSGAPLQYLGNNYQFLFIGNAVDGGTPWQDFKWGLAVHDSHYGLVKDTVVYNVAGSGIVTEDGSESYNVIESNFVVRVTGTGSRLDGGRDGVGFWFRGPNNSIRDNVAANINPTGTYCYGYNFDQEYLGNIREPNFPGADTAADGEYTMRDGHALPLRQFARNEIYGATSNGLFYSWLGSQFMTPRATQESVVQDMRIWNTNWLGIFHYPAHKITFDGLVIRNGGTGFTSGDYFLSEVVIRNANIQGAAVGIGVGTLFGSPQVVENSYLRNGVNVGLGNLNWVGADATGLPPRTIILRNVRMDPWGDNSNIARSLEEWTLGFATVNLIVRDQVLVYDHNGVPGDNFEVFLNEQRPDYIVPQSVESTFGAFPRVLGSPVAGLTNQQNWDQYGIAIAGAVSPCATTRPGIVGLVCPLSAPPPARRGDLNGDGLVNVVDKTTLDHFLVGNITQGSPQFPEPLWVADCNNDGIAADSRDAVYLANYLVGTIPGL